MPQKYGHLANAEPFERRACLVCDSPDPTYSWTDMSGEGYCTTCGTPYQLKWGDLKEDETYPRCNLRPDFISVVRRFWQEQRVPNGLGTFLGFGSYQDQAQGRLAFNEWFAHHATEYPQFARKADDDTDQKAMSA